jgi:hypothetical protein
MNDDDEDQVVPPVSGRSQHFGEGILSGGGLSGGAEISPGLQESARRFNAAVPTAYRGLGSSNGMAASQYQATMGGMFATQNGSALDTYATKKFYGGNN